MIEVNNLTIQFAGSTIVNDLSFHLPGGSKATLKGLSGSGKSSVLMALLGFVKPAKGTIKINGIVLSNSTIKEIRSVISWVPQELTFDLNYARELLLLPFSFKQNRPNSPTQDQINEMLVKFGLLPGILDKHIKELSGGEKQRISLCSSLLQKKPLLLLDEPTSALDTVTKLAITKLFMQNNDLTILSASHDDLWAEYSDNIINVSNFQNTNNMQ